MNCDEARRLLDAYFDRELERSAVDEIEMHLERCEHCRSELAALEELHARLARAPRYKAPTARNVDGSACASRRRSRSHGVAKLGDGRVAAVVVCVRRNRYVAVCEKC